MIASDNFYTLCKYFEGLNDNDLSMIGLQPKNNYI
jgi:hypothetical protein